MIILQPPFAINLILATSDQSLGTQPHSLGVSKPDWTVLPQRIMTGWMIERPVVTSRQARHSSDLIPFMRFLVLVHIRNAIHRFNWTSHPSSRRSRAAPWLSNPFQKTIRPRSWVPVIVVFCSSSRGPTRGRGVPIEPYGI